MCLYSELIINPKYKSTTKNGGVIPPLLDQRIKWLPIGCNKCIECMKDRSNTWTTRLHEDIKTHKNGVFVTLTFSDEEINNLIDKYKITTTGYAQDNEIATRATRLFVENWRKEYKHSIRHWLITELGHTNTERIHIHGLIWPETIKERDSLERKWKYGHTWQGGYVNGETISYITKYVNKVDFDHKYYKPIILTSPGIGRDYLKTHNAWQNRYKGKETKTTYTTISGHTMKLPIYWKNHLYTEEQREALWLHTLDKEERYILGQRISVKDGNYETYNKILKNARLKNTELGYGDNITTYNEVQYEEAKRQIIHETRKQKTKTRANK